eukprot:364838-Chlamydomonas_euryale.AAC.13
MTGHMSRTHTPQSAQEVRAGGTTGSSGGGQCESGGGQCESGGSQCESSAQRALPWHCGRHGGWVAEAAAAQLLFVTFSNVLSIPSLLPILALPWHAVCCRSWRHNGALYAANLGIAIARCLLPTGTRLILR